MTKHRSFILWLAFISLISCLSFSLVQIDLPALVKKVKPAVVLIYTYDFNDKLIGQGSGFFINVKGVVITNYHLLEGAYRGEVKTSQGMTYIIKGVIGEDIEGDLVKILLDASNKTFPYLQVSANLPEEGERVLVIGNPLGLEQTISDGIVSAVRDIASFGMIIQITAPISPGSSGSPVMNMRGEVVGIAALQYEEGQSINFAIPGERIINLKSMDMQSFQQWTTGIGGEGLESAEDLFLLGLGHILKEEYKSALPYFEEAVKKKPDFAKAHFWLGWVYDEFGRYTEAIEAFKQAIRFQPNDAEAYCILGWVYDELDLYAEAIIAYKQAIRLQPDYADVHYNLGIVYTKVDQHTAAIKAFKQAIRLQPDDAGAHYNLGVAYSELSRYNDAIESYKQAIRIKPDYAEAHFNLSCAYGELGRYIEEIEALKMAIRIKPDYAEAHYNLGVNYGVLGRYKEAIEAFKEAIRIKPDFAEAHCSLGVNYGKIGRDREAIEALKIAILIQPDYALAHFNLGLCYFILSDKASALDEYKILKTLDPTLANKLFNLIYK